MPVVRPAAPADDCETEQLRTQIRKVARQLGWIALVELLRLVELGMAHLRRIRADADDRRSGKLDLFIGLLVLDVDPGSGGPESLAALERSYDPLPRTTRSRTGGGGVHVFFRYPAEKEVRNSAGWLGLGLDVRGEGGYVVVPPSRTQGPYE